MATLNDVLKLRGTIPGITITQTIDSYSKKPIIVVSFRKAAFEGGQRSTLEPKSFKYTPEGFKNAIKHFKKLKTKYKDSIAKIGTVTSATFAKEYSQKKLQFADDLINKIDELTKDPTNKTIKQVESKLFKAFNIPKYTKVDKGVDFRNAFFQPDKKFFSIPRDYEIYGGAYGKKKISENQTALRQIIGTKFFANNPNYEKVAGLLTAFYTDPKSKFTKKENDTMRKFVKDFSVTRSVKGDTIPARFFKELDFDFGRRLKEFGKIFNLTEYLQEQIKNPKISRVDKGFYQKELTSLLNNRRDVLLPLSKKYPNLFKYGVSPAGNLQFEHRVARSLGEIGDVKLPKDYIARGSYVPGRFNQAKYYAYDKPLMDLVSEYNLATKSEKPNVRLKIENLTKDFNKRSGGFLENVGFDFKDKVKIIDKSRLASEAKGADVLFDIDKTLEQSNKFFRSLGDETVKGLPKGSVASDFVLKGKEYKSFKKLVDTVKASPESCRQILDMQTGGISKTCAAALETDPFGSAQKLSQLDSTGPLAKVKNAALNFLKRGGKFGAIAAVGAAGAGLVKKFMNDDPTTYLSDENQQKNMLIDMITQPIDDTPEDRPEILDYTLPVIGGAAAAGTAAVAPSTIKAARSAALGSKKSGITKTGLKTLGRGLATLGSPAALLATEPFFIGEQIAAGDSAAEIATNPLNYLGAAFADPATRFATKGTSPAIAKAIRLGISPGALRVASRAFGLPGLALSLGISGYELFDDYRNKRGFFSEE